MSSRQNNVSIFLFNKYTISVTKNVMNVSLIHAIKNCRIYSRIMRNFFFSKILVMTSKVCIHYTWDISENCIKPYLLSLGLFFRNFRNKKWSVRYTRDSSKNCMKLYMPSLSLLFFFKILGIRKRGVHYTRYNFQKLYEAIHASTT